MSTTTPPALSVTCPICAARPGGPCENVVRGWIAGPTRPAPIPCGNRVRRVGQREPYLERLTESAQLWAEVCGITWARTYCGLRPSQSVSLAPNRIDHGVDERVGLVALPPHGEPRQIDGQRFTVDEMHS